MTVPHRSLTPARFPGLMRFPRAVAPPEPNWMVESGWWELTNVWRPGLRLICETTWDIHCELAIRPKLILWRAVRRGSAREGHRIAGVFQVAIGMVDGTLVMTQVKRENPGNAGRSRRPGACDAEAPRQDYRPGNVSE